MIFKADIHYSFFPTLTGVTYVEEKKRKALIAAFKETTNLVGGEGLKVTLFYVGLDEVSRTLKSRAEDWCWLGSKFKVIFCLMKTSLIFL